MTEGRQKRCVFTDGLKNKHAFQEFEEGVYCVIGPFTGFTSDTELQDELENICRRFNLRHGHLSQDRYEKLTKGRA
jgi:hypothetical protein